MEGPHLPQLKHRLASRGGLAAMLPAAAAAAVPPLCTCRAAPRLEGNECRLLTGATSRHTLSQHSTASAASFVRFDLSDNLSDIVYLIRLVKIQDTF